jgi:hypothetical protein
VSKSQLNGLLSAGGGLKHCMTQLRHLQHDGRSFSEWVRVVMLMLAAFL